jgi:rhamnose utilization protein RhaD (predicted bifunctional aldolase and dehydrogenase)/NAD(P)-dependent dehydrogenase (short-subunit alcohol dehydrogenase family)
MRSKWSDEEAAGFVARYGADWGEPLALRTYSSRLLGAEPDLVLHGGGNSSVKAWWTNALGEELPALFVKASGADMATIEPSGHPGLDLAYLRRLRGLPDLNDEAMVEELRTHLLRAGDATPSIEALVHAFLPGTFIDHTHADAILALTNRDGGDTAVREALGEEVIVLPYVTPGFKLAQAAAAAAEAAPAARAIVWAYHGLVTWGDTARASYELMIDLVTRAEDWAAARRAARGRAAAFARDGAWPPVAAAGALPGYAADPAVLAAVMPVVRGLLAGRTADCDRPYRRVIVQALADAGTLAALAAPEARHTLVTPPLTSDHLIRTKALPLWVEAGDLAWGGAGAAEAAGLRDRVAEAVSRYCDEYAAYLGRYEKDMPAGVEAFDPQPRVVLMPGVGAFCAGSDLRESVITRDITAHTIAVKTAVAAEGASYQGLPEAELFRMEYRTLQHKKLAGGAGALRGHVALVTGAAGAIGTGICQGLLEAGCLVAATDLPGAALDTLLATVGAAFPGRLLGVPLDVTDPASVVAGFAEVCRTWGGVDLVIPNAGIAAVAPLTELTLERFRALEKVNVEGTLLVIAEAARLFRRQGTGGDIVLVSTKNVFSPGADFGAYSSTKAAAHQLARIASLELAADDVRVNMVSPDAVFAHGTCRSGLWAEVGPGRMKARGLDEAGLEAYYQSRNLLKAQVTAAHVANAVLFFATRQTPTTGATIPVDGGLPDSTPR